MSITNYKRIIYTLLFIVVLCLGYIWILRWKLYYERIDTRAVWNVIVDYKNTRNRFNRMSVDDDIAYLEAYKNASEGLVSKNEDLARILAFERTRILSEIMADLRKKTGENLEDPDKWINKYSSSSDKGPK